jgi:hypothetical protein
MACCITIYDQTLREKKEGGGRGVKKREREREREREIETPQEAKHTHMMSRFLKMSICHCTLQVTSIVFEPARQRPQLILP